MKRSRFTDQQIAFALQQAEQGTQVGDGDSNAWPLVAEDYQVMQKQTIVLGIVLGAKNIKGLEIYLSP